jgi:hypothetical protein
MANIGRGNLDDSLPNSSLITGSAKTLDKISISPKSVCGVDDFRCLREKEARTSGVDGGDYSAQE